MNNNNLNIDRLSLKQREHLGINYVNFKKKSNISTLTHLYILYKKHFSNVELYRVI